MNQDQPSPDGLPPADVPAKINDHLFELFEDKPRPDRAAVEQILIDYSRVRQYTFQEATDAILSLLEKARTQAVLDELDGLIPQDMRIGEGYYSVPGPWFDEHYAALSKGADKDE